MGKGGGGAARVARHEPAAAQYSPKKGQSEPGPESQFAHSYMAPQQMGFWPQDVMYVRGLQELILNQVHYYFSPDNLVKDDFLRKHMDLEGFIPIQLLASFNRLRQISNDPNLIAEVRAGRRRLCARAPLA